MDNVLYRALPFNPTYFLKIVFRRTRVHQLSGSSQLSGADESSRNASGLRTRASVRRGRIDFLRFYSPERENQMCRGRESDRSIVCAPCKGGHRQGDEAAKTFFIRYQSCFKQRECSTLARLLLNFKSWAPKGITLL